LVLAWMLLRVCKTFTKAPGRREYNYRNMIPKTMPIATVPPKISSDLKRVRISFMETPSCYQSMTLRFES
jgi:hypothetical protein